MLFLAYQISLKGYLSINDEINPKREGGGGVKRGNFQGMTWVTSGLKIVNMA